MKGFLFQAVATVSAWHIATIQWISGLLCSTIGNVSYWLMKRIDAKKVAVYEEVLRPEGQSELEAQGLELKLMGSAIQVRDHALETDDWTEQHTEALNAIGDALIVEAGWEEDNVHTYLKELVESIDGLEYGLEG